MKGTITTLLKILDVEAGNRLPDLPAKADFLAGGYLTI